jgi:hypothetical protein
VQVIAHAAAYLCTAAALVLVAREVTRAAPPRTPTENDMSGWMKKLLAQEWPEIAHAANYLLAAALAAVATYFGVPS